MYICNRLQEEENEKARFGDYIRYISVARIVHAKGVVKNATDKKTALMAYPFGCLLYLIRYKGA
jgi:hypothetical protein